MQINTILITSGILSHTLNTQYGQRARPYKIK